MSLMYRGLIIVAAAFVLLAVIAYFAARSG